MVLWLWLTATEAERQDRDKRIMDLLRQDDKYDAYQAMIITQMHDFQEGILYLFGRTKQYQQIVHYYMEKKAYAGMGICIAVCRCACVCVCLLNSDKPKH